MTVKVGQSLGQYVILEQIGKGGMATVFRASQPSLSRQVAIKVLPEFFADDPAFNARFRQEAMAIAKLRHPNILTVFDSGEADGVAYIVTELVDGGTLADKLGRPLPLDYCVTIAMAAGQALDYAHARGMVHRDVKPSNILLGTDGAPILSDFGLALITGASDGKAITRLTATGTALGTPEYMAPEQVASSAVGPPADIYALAVTLYEMLTGSVPYQADTPIQVIAARLRDPLPLPRVRNPELSEAIQNVLLKGLADEPGDRYASAGEMARALDAAVRLPAAATQPASAAPWSTSHDATKPVASSRVRPFAWAATAGAMVIALVLWLTMKPSTTSGTTRPGTTPAATSSSPASQSPSGTPPIAPAVPTSAPATSPPAPSPTPVPTNVAAKNAAATNGVTATTASANPTATTNATTSATTSANAAKKPSRGGSAGDAVPPHGRLLYSLSSSASELAAFARQRNGDSITAKGSALELRASTDSGLGIRFPVQGIGDFVAVLRYVALDQRPLLTFRFHVTPQGQGYAVRLPAYLKLSPPAKGTRGEPVSSCCRPFDVFLAPQVPGSQSILSSAEPVSVSAAGNEEQAIVVSATGPDIAVFADGQEIARASNSSFGPGGMSLGVTRQRGEGQAKVRLVSLDVYEPPASNTKVAASQVTALPPHGKLLFAFADHLSDVARTPQPKPENTIVVRGNALEFTVGSDANLVVPLQVNGISDFVAVMRYTNVNLKAFLQLRFHRSPQADHVVQIPAYQRLGPPAAGAQPVGAHPCCQEFDVFTAPQTGAPTLFNGPQLRAVPASPNDEQVIVLSVSGPLLTMFANGVEVARVPLDVTRPGGMSLQVQARGHQIPAVLRMNALEIYEAAPAH